MSPINGLTGERGRARHSKCRATRMAVPEKLKMADPLHGQLTFNVSNKGIYPPPPNGKWNTKKKKTVETEKKTVAGRRGNPVIIIIHFLEPWTWAGRKFYVKLISPASTGPFTLHHPVSLSFSLSLSISFGDTVDSPHFSQDVRVFVRTHKSVSWLFFLSLPDCQFTQKLWSWKVDYPWFIAASFESWNCLSHTHSTHTHTHPSTHTSVWVSGMLYLYRTDMYLCIFCCQHVSSLCISNRLSVSHLGVSRPTLYLLTFLCAFFLFENLSSILGLFITLRCISRFGSYAH